MGKYLRLGPVLVIVGLMASMSCAGRDPVWEAGPQATPENAAELAAVRATADSLFSARGDKRSLSAAIATYLEATLIAPRDPALWTQLSRAYYFMADAHVRFEQSPEGDRRREMAALFEQGAGAAERALVVQSPEFARRVQAGTPVEQAIEVLDRDAVPAMYWRSANLAKWALLRGNLSMVSYRDETRAVMNRCLELNPDYFFGGPHRYFGAFFAGLPAAQGRDLAESRRHFQRALGAHPEHLGGQTLFAEFHLVATGDRERFLSSLRTVVDTEPDSSSVLFPENQVERKRARRLLRQVDELFDE